MKKAVLPACLYPQPWTVLWCNDWFLGHLNIVSRFIVQAFQEVVSEIGIRTEIE